MLETSARLLRLLALLQAHPTWAGPDLAGRLGVTTRTVRQDVARLRALGYVVESTPGAAGGYRLGAGTGLPPLLLDDEEAVAVAMGLRTAAGGTIAGLEEAGLRALRKLEQVLPSRLGHRVATLSEATRVVHVGVPTVDVSVLTGIAAAVRAREVLRFDYQGRADEPSRREAEPYRLLHTGRRWYFLGWDLARRDWRTYRVDRMLLRTPNGPRFTARPAPDGGFETLLRQGLSSRAWPVTARVLMHAPIERLLTKATLTGGFLEPVDATSCLLEVGADNVAFLLVMIGVYDVDFTVLEPASLAELCHTMAGRYARAAAATTDDHDHDRA